MLRAMATVTYFAADLNAARRWYSDLLGVGPYFERPGYVSSASATSSRNWG